MISSKIMIRYLIFAIGLFLMGLGISLTTKSNLGTSPISSVPYVLSMGFPVTFGQVTFLLSLLFISAEIIILRKNFPPKQFFQIAVGSFFGLFIDFGMFIFAAINPIHYAVKISTLVVGCMVLALGVYLQIIANVLVNPGEGIVKVIANKLGKEFGVVKIAFDSTLVVVAVVISLLSFGTIQGLREGTVISAILVGYMTKIFSTVFSHYNFEKMIY